MKLWTLQPIEVWETLNNKGFYICEPNKAELLKEYSFQRAYSWLIKEMEKRIGERPEGVVSPVWAWYKRNWKNKKPDLRESAYGKHGEKMVCIEIEKNYNEVVLSDFDDWHSVLNNCYCDKSISEEEWDKEHNWFNSLNSEKAEKVKRKSWEYIFDITPFQNDWRSRGRYVQGTFWVLYLSEVRNFQFFICK